MLNKLLLRIFILVVGFFFISVQNNYSNDILRKITIKEYTVDGIKYQSFYIEKSQSKNYDERKNALVQSNYLLTNNSDGTILKNSTKDGLKGKLFILDNSKETNLELYPNPVTDILNVTLGNNTDKITNISVLDLTGKTMEEFVKINIVNKSLDVHNLLNGIYLLRITLTDSNYYTMQFIKQ
jgi:hypothetical protein